MFDFRAQRYIKKADSKAADEGQPSFTPTEVEIDAEEGAKKKKKREKIGFRDRKVDSDIIIDEIHCR